MKKSPGAFWPLNNSAVNGPGISAGSGVVGQMQEQPTQLLGAIKSIWASVGYALNDYELACFLQKSTLPSEAGFGFLSFSCGRVTLTVPRQNPNSW
ncbi:MAG TPA: hypothetical protein VGY56_16225 [Verrucomicrobiae bacterium]|nr:hypothetical protein [Verrucomicrobiae bacterium]